jgi:hypothetical protein
VSAGVWHAADTAPVASSSPLVRFWAVWDRFWFAPRPLVSLALLRVVTFGTLLMYIAQEYVWVMRLQDVDASFYRPILAFELFGVGPIPPGLAAALRAILVVGGVLGLLGIRARLAAAVCAVAYLYSVGQVYSFTNVHHGDSLLGIALVVLALSPSTGALSILSRWRRGAHPEPAPSAPVSGWPVQLVRVQIAVTYFLAGYAKLVLAGPAWGDGVSLQHYLLLRGQPVGYWLAEHPAVCAVLSVTTLVLELTFPVVLFWPRLRWLYVPAAVAFHLVSEYVLGVGFSFFLPFLLVYVDPLPAVQWLRAQRGTA